MRSGHGDGGPRRRPPGSHPRGQANHCRASFGDHSGAGHADKGFRWTVGAMQAVVCLESEGYVHWRWRQAGAYFYLCLVFHFPWGLIWHYVGSPARIWGVLSLSPSRVCCGLSIGFSVREFWRCPGEASAAVLVLECKEALKCRN